EFNKAAHLYLQAKECQPDDETAQINEAFAYQLLHELEKAHALALILIKQYPHSSRLCSVYVRTAPEALSLEEIEEAIPSSVRNDAEVAVALAARATEQDKLGRAETYARAATISGPRLSFPFVALADAITRREVGDNLAAHGMEGILNDERLAD